MTKHMIRRVAMWGAALMALATVVGAATKPAPRDSAITHPALSDTSRRVPVEGHPAVFLSWHAPYGMPGARDAAVATCDDSTAADTLYISFDPGENVGGLVGIDARLTFRALPGDSLGPFWDFSRTGANPWNLRIEFDEPPDGAQSPWPVAGSGSVRYGRRREAGQLDISYAIAASWAGPIAAGQRYFFARVMLRLRRPRLGGCRQPVCVELDHMIISHGGVSRWVTAGERFVSWNSPEGAACKEHRLRPPMAEPAGYEEVLHLRSEDPSRSAAPRDSTR